MSHASYFLSLYWDHLIKKSPVDLRLNWFQLILSLSHFLAIRGLLKLKKEYLESCLKLMKNNLKPRDNDSLVVLNAEYLDR